MLSILRIRYTNKKSIFEYEVRRADVAEKVAEHAAVFGYEMLPDPNAKTHTLSGEGFTAPVEIPATTMIVEWVTNPRTPEEKVELLTHPTAPK